VIAAAARTVQPPDLALVARGCERVQHREHRRRADTRADQEQGRGAGREREGAARGGDVEQVAGPHPRVEIIAGNPISFPLDADPVGVGAGRP
jgi:hypothetical protein